MADAPIGKRVVDLQKYVPDLNKKSNTFYGPNVLIGLNNSTIGIRHCLYIILRLKK